MIFESVSHITNKALFIELVDIYIRLTEVFAERNNKTIDKCDITGDIVDEMKNIGVVDNVSDLSLLNKAIGKELTAKFINSVGFYINHRDEIGGLLDNLSNKRRKEIQQKAASSVKPTYVDFFAGAGGLSLGFTQSGFRSIFANDYQDVCVATYKYNHPEVPSSSIVEGDIRLLSGHIEDYINENVDIVIGGPPCQGFSSANKQRVIDDPRNELYKYYVDSIRRILPKFVVMENVKGMLSVANQVIEDYESIDEERNGQHYSYKIAYKLFNSADFSVAQSRERLIYIAIRNDIAETKGITPQNIFEDIERNNVGKCKYLLRDALEYIKPLEAPRVKNQNDIDTEENGKKIDVNQNVGNDNGYLTLINGNREIPYIFNHKARYVNDINYDIYRLLNQGEDATAPQIADIMPYAHRNHCFKDKYYKLIADRPSRTITAHLRMDCHSHIHPFQIRSLTPREAARCQAFPDDYLFLGAYLKTYMQIGNAVPVVMAKGIADAIKKYL